MRRRGNLVGPSSNTTSMTYCSFCRQKQTPNCVCKCVSPSLSELEPQLELEPQNHPQPLAPPTQEIIPQKWSQKNTLQRILTGLGWVLAIFIAIGTGVSTTAAFIALNLVTGGAATVLGAILIFTAGFSMNLLINTNAVPDVFIAIFGMGKLFKGLIVNGQGSALSPERKALMALGVFLALCVGFTNGVLIYSSTLALATPLAFLGLAASAFPPIAIVLGCITLVCLSAVMLKSIAILIQKPTEQLKEDCWMFWAKLCSTEDTVSYKEKTITLEHNKNKSKTQRQIERFFRMLFIGLAIPLAALGLIMTMNASAAGAKVFLLKNIPHASIVGVEIASKVITLVFALLGRIPFTFRNIFDTTDKIFLYAHAYASATSAWVEEPAAEPAKLEVFWYYTKVVVLYSLAFVNAIGNALISVMGGGGVPSGLGGGLNSWLAGASNIKIKPLKAAQSQGVELRSLLSSTTVASDRCDDHSSGAFLRQKRSSLISSTSTLLPSGGSGVGGVGCLFSPPSSSNKGDTEMNDPTKRRDHIDSLPAEATGLLAADLTLR